MAGTARSGPAPSSITSSATSARSECRVVREGHGQGSLLAPLPQHGDDVRRLAGLRDAQHHAPGHARRSVVERHQRRRRQRHVQAVPGTQHVLGVERGMVGRSPRGDDHGVHRPAADGAGDLPDLPIPGLQQPGDDPRALGQLVAHGGGHCAVQPPSTDTTSR